MLGTASTLSRCILAGHVARKKYLYRRGTIDHVVRLFLLYFRQVIGNDSMKTQRFSHSTGFIKRKELARCIFLAYSVSVGLGLTVNAAHAQDTTPAVAATPAAPAADAPATGIQSVTVTARKVAERAQDVPLPVTAFGAKDLEDKNIQKLSDLNNLTPGLNFQDGTGTTSGRGGPGKFLVRGLSGGTLGTSRASTFLDGVYVANSVANILFGEIERVEVMLGPQSTQFGRSTFAGALNYITKDPKNAVHGDFAVSRASLGERTVDAYISGGLIDNVLLGSVYFGSQVFDGPGSWRNPADKLHPDGYQLGSTETNTLSGKLIWKPIEGLRISTRLSYTVDHDAPAVGFELGPQYRTTAYTQVRNGVSQPAYYVSGVVNAPNAFKGGYPDAVLNLDNEKDPDYRNRTTRATVIADYALGDNSLRATVSDNWENTTHGQYGDSDLTYFPAYVFSPNRNTVRDKSVELRFDTDQSQKLRFSAGVYFLQIKGTQNTTSAVDYTCTTVCIVNSPAALYSASTDVSGFTGNIVKSGYSAPYIYQTGVRDQSIFGGVFYDFTDKWTGSFEGRFQEETVRNLNLSNPLSPIGGDAKFDSFLPRFNLQYKVNPHAQVYAIASRGSNPGGLNTATQIGKAGTGTTDSMRTIKEETLDNYELGFKSMWLHDTLRINGSYYHMNWKNMQSNATYYDPASTSFSVVENRGGAQVDGIGIDGEWMASENLSFTGQFSYNDARYTNYCSPQLALLLYGPASATNPLAGGSAECLTKFNTRGVSVAGNKLETSPAKTASANFDYHRPLVDGWKWYTRGGIQYSDGMYESEMNLAKSPNAVIYNLSAGLERGRWTYEVSCRNCSDEDSPDRFARLTDVRTSSNSVSAGGLGYNQTVGGNLRRPRQFGFNMRYKF